MDHHDKAYAWAERRKIERHPKTGAAQLVVMPEVASGSIHFEYDGSAPPSFKPTLFNRVSDAEFLSYGVPREWLDAVRDADEDTLFDLIDRLPQEAAEALLELATGGKPTIPAVVPATADPFTHPDAQRRFRVMTNVEELERALEFPWEKWTVFLHPAQRALVERDYSGSARISGSAGTGKSVVALHRAVHQAREHPNACVLLATFSQTLSDLLNVKLGRLVGNEPEVNGRISVSPMPGVAMELFAKLFGAPQIASIVEMKLFLNEASRTVREQRFSQSFLLGEWTDVVDAWQLKTWDTYRDVARLGRKTRLGSKQREQLWTIFEQVRAKLDQRGLVTWPEIFGRITEHLSRVQDRPFDFAVIDEAQDMGIAEVRFLKALGSTRADGLFFTGDLGQRIFQQPFSWKSLGVDVRGRSHTLRINYRTSHQIRSHADRLLPASLADVDGIEERRRGTVSMFNGQAPSIEVFDDSAQETAAVGRWISVRLTEGIQPEEIGVFVRSEPQLERAIAAIRAAGIAAIPLKDRVEIEPGRVVVGTMHLAKGLEFRAVAVMACDDEVIPLQDRIESIADEADLEEVYSTERHLLYVACTRARDHLLVTGVKPASEFLDDML